MVTLHFRGIFGQAREFFGRILQILLKNIFILMSHGVSGSVSTQMPIFEAFNCSIWRNSFYFTKNALHLKKN